MTFCLFVCLFLIYYFKLAMNWSDTVDIETIEICPESAPCRSSGHTALPFYL